MADAAHADESALSELRQQLAMLKQAFETHLQNRLDQRTADMRQRDEAKASIDKRLDGMNEFREALRDQSMRFVERREFDLARDAISERVAPLRADLGDRVDEMTIRLATLVNRREFEDARTAGIERVETVRASTEIKLIAMNGMFVEKLDQARSSRDARSEADLAPIRTALAIHGKPNWGLIVSAAAVMFATISGGWLVIGLKIDTATSPITLDLAATKATTVQNADRLRYVETASNSSTQADIASRSDRLQISDRLHALEAVVPPVATVNTEVQNLKANYNLIVDRMQTIRSDQVQIKADLVEIETQFCGEDNLRNQIHAYDMRFLSMMWKKIFDSVMPTDNAFYAQIGKCMGVTTGKGR